MSYLGWVQRFLLLGCLLCSTLLQARPVSLEVVQEFGSDPYGPLLQVGDHIVAAGLKDRPYYNINEFSGLLDILKFEQNKFSLVGQTDVKKLLPPVAEIQIAAISAHQNYVYLLVNGWFKNNVRSALLTLRLEEHQLKLHSITSSDLYYGYDAKIHVGPMGLLYVTAQDSELLYLQSFALQSDGTPKQVAARMIASIEFSSYLEDMYFASLNDKTLLVTLNSNPKQNKLADRFIQITLSEQGIVTDILPLKLSEAESKYNFSHYDGDYLYLHSWQKGLQVYKMHANELVLRDQISNIPKPLGIFNRGGTQFLAHITGIQRLSKDSAGKLVASQSIYLREFFVENAVVLPEHVVVSAHSAGIIALRFDGNRLANDAKTPNEPKEPIIFTQASQSKGLVKIGSSLINSGGNGLAVWQQDPQTQQWKPKTSNLNTTGLRRPYYLSVAAVGDRLLATASGSLVSFDTKQLPNLTAGSFIYRLSHNTFYEGLIHALSQGYLVIEKSHLAFFDNLDNLRLLSPMATWVADNESYTPLSTVAGQHVYLSVNGNYSDDGFTSKIKVLDAGNLNSIKQVGEITLKDAKVISKLLIKDNFLIVHKEQDHTKDWREKLDVYDISDLSKIRLVSSTYAEHSSRMTGIQWIGNYLFTQNKHTIIYDMSNPAAPVKVGGQAYVGSNGQLNVVDNEIFNVQYNHLGRIQQLRLNYAPTAKDLTLQVAQNGVLQYQLQGTDPENDELTFTVATAPEQGALTITDGKFLQYEPNASFVGKDKVGLRVQDKVGGFSLFNLTIEVIATNLPPEVKKLSLQTTQNQSIAALLEASDPNGDVLTYQIVEAPLNGSAMVSARGEVQFNPHNGFIGEDQFTVRISDGKLTVDTVVDVEVIKAISTNQAPQVKKLTLTTSQNQSVTAHLDASDPDGDALSYQIVTEATNGTADISAQGQIQFRPRRGFIGLDAFTVRVSDGQLTVDAIVDVEVDAGWSWFD